MPLLEGFRVLDLTSVLVVGEALYVAAYASRLEEKMAELKGSLWISKQDWQRS